MNKTTDFTPSNASWMSDDIRAITSSLAKAKRQFGTTGLTGSNSHQKYNYAKIDDIFGAVESALLDNDIVIIQASKRFSEVEHILYSRLIHYPTGQYIEDERLLISEKPGNQGMGSAQTYMRKYAILALCTLCPNDDDGEDEQKYIKGNYKDSALLETQINELIHEIKLAKNKDKLVQDILSFNKITTIRSLKQSQFLSVKDYIIKNREIINAT